MNYVPGYGHDIFVSYAQVDDLTGRDDEDGWVSALINMGFAGSKGLRGVRRASRGQTPRGQTPRGQKLTCTRTSRPHEKSH
jgi:hypothetical protein